MKFDLFADILRNKCPGQEWKFKQCLGEKSHELVSISSSFFFSDDNCIPQLLPCSGCVSRHRSRQIETSSSGFATFVRPSLM